MSQLTSASQFKVAFKKAIDGLTDQDFTVVDSEMTASSASVQKITSFRPQGKKLGGLLSKTRGAVNFFLFGRDTRICVEVPNSIDRVNGNARPSPGLSWQRALGYTTTLKRRVRPFQHMPLPIPTG